MKLISFFLLLCGPLAGAYSHAHIFIKQKLTLEVQGPQVLGLRVEWEFDEMTSSLVLQDYRQDREGRFLSPGKEELRDSFYTGLTPYGFYAHFTWNAVPLKTQRPEQFEAFARNGRLYYRFLYPIQKAFKPGDRMEGGFWDETYFTDFTFLNPGVQVVPNQAPVSGEILKEGGQLPYGGVAPMVRFSFR